MMHITSTVLERTQPAAAAPPLGGEATIEVPSASPLRAFKNRDFLLLCVGAFISSVGTWMERVAVGVWVTETTGLAAATGLVTAMLFVPVAVLGPLGGALSDRADRKKWLLWITVAQAVIAALLAGLASLHWLTVPLVSLLMFLTGCGSVLLTAGFNAAIADLVPKRDLTSAMFLNSGQWNLARVVGPLLAAPAIALGSTALAFWLNAVSFGGVLVAVAYLRPIPRRADARAESLKVALLNGARVARDDRGISSALTITALVGFFIAPFIGLVPVFALQVLREGPAAASLLVAAQGGGAVVAALLSASLLDRVGAGRWMRLTCIAITAVTAAFWVTPNLTAAMGTMLVLGAVYLSVVTGCGRAVLGRAPPGTQARIASLYHVTLDATYALGLIIAGAAADAVGLRKVGVAGALLFGAILWVLAVRRRDMFSALE
ncbi:MAG: MFS transporter [Archangiaceae bacterium]|nr:MFS transporter [Archangiaceae bacterium]